MLFVSKVINIAHRHHKCKYCLSREDAEMSCPLYRISGGSDLTDPNHNRVEIAADETANQAV